LSSGGRVAGLGAGVAAGAVGCRELRGVEACAAGRVARRGLARGLLGVEERGEREGERSDG
jgi:hypothetical protein